jgi:hypothetical protein
VARANGTYPRVRDRRKDGNRRSLRKFAHREGGCQVFASSTTGVVSAESHCERVQQIAKPSPLP